MISESLKKKILKKLNSERARRRKRAIKQIPLVQDQELIEYLILVVQIEEKEIVRKEAYLKLGEIPSNNKEIDKAISKALRDAVKNEPKEEMRNIAKKALENRLPA